MVTMQIDRPTASAVDDDGFVFSKIDEANMPYVISLLAEAYTKPIDGVIRELMANGRDAHHAAGRIGHAVFVTLPTAEGGPLVVSDSGTGMDENDLGSVYGDYAASTRRADDLAVGHFGIGAKSPFGISDEFTVQTVKNGVLLEILFKLLADGRPGYKIVTRTLADVPNGTTVTVPLENAATWDWVQAAKRVVFWQDSGSAWVESPGADFVGQPKIMAENRDEILSTAEVTVVNRVHDGNARDRQYNQYTWNGLANGITTSRTNFVRMGQVGYELPSSMGEELFYRAYEGGLVFEVAIDAIQLQMSRETIADTEGNRELLRTIYETWVEEMRSRYNPAIMAATTLLELWEVFNAVPFPLRESYALGYSDFHSLANEKVGLPLEQPAQVRRYANETQSTTRDTLTLDVALELVGEKARVLRMPEATGKTIPAITRWRRLHRELTLFVVHEHQLAPIVDPARLNWITAKEIVAQGHPDKKVPLLTDEEFVVRPWRLQWGRRNYGDNPSVKIITAGEIREKVAEGCVLVVDTRTEMLMSYNSLMTDAPKTVHVLRGGDSIETVEALLGLEALSIKGYYERYKRISVNSHDAELAALSPDERQRLVDINHVGYSRIAGVRQLLTGERIASTAVRMRLTEMVGLLGEESREYQHLTYLAETPGMPAPSAIFELPLTLELLGAYNPPSAALVTLVLQADLKAQKAKAALTARVADSLAAAGVGTTTPVPQPE